MTFLIDLANRTYYFEDANIGEALNSRRYQFLAFDGVNIHNQVTIGALYEMFKNSHMRVCVLWMDRDTGEQFADLMSYQTIHQLFQDDDIDAIFNIWDLKSIG